MEGTEVPMIFSAVFTEDCQVLQSEIMQFAQQTVMDMVKLLSLVPL